jgi:UDP-galactopyranose mutase
MCHNSEILVFSHLRWDFVYQRPQHLLSRLAKRRRVIFIEEPVFDQSVAAHWEYSRPAENVLVARPHTPVRTAGFSDEQWPHLKSLIHELVQLENLIDYIVWLYTPMALPVVQELQPKAIVYDCMDELSAFLHAPPQLVERETELLKLADVVFTGGPSLYRAKQNRHPNVHCFPSSVDAGHFAVARDPACETRQQADLPRPRLGFYGVIDERIDLRLLDDMARAHPEWQIVMVGPVVKIHRGDLPQHPNLHYFGQQDYMRLPSFLAGWDLCILPFAENRSTEFISPTKTLEYMAAEKLIVSTPIPDVVEPYRDIVYSGKACGEFLAACEQALGASKTDRARRVAKMREILSSTSWDATASAMEELLLTAVRETRRLPDGVFEPRRASQAAHTPRVQQPSTVVVGAGPTGLSAAYHLGADALLLEQNDRAGGWCRSLESNGFTFDFAGHIMFSNEPYVHQLYKVLLGENVHWLDREAWIFSKGVYTRYPFQGSLYGLPPHVIKECIVGAIEARFGNLRPKKSGSANGGVKAHGNGTNGVHCTPSDAIKDCCADGVLESTAKLEAAVAVERPATEPRNFEEFIYKVWGAGIAKHFAIPYNRKLWAVPLSEMETSWLGGRVPMPDLEEIIEGALSPSRKPMGPNARFGYPLRGGFQALMDGFLPHLRGVVRYNSRVVAVSPSRHTVTLQDGNTFGYEHLVSTMPLPVLIRSIGHEAPAQVREAAASLRHVSVRCVHIGVGRENITDKHWIYYPEQTVFHRIFVQGNASPYCNPPGGFGFTCEITYSPHKPLPCTGSALIERCIDDAREVGFIRRDDPIWAGVQCDLPYAYVVYDHGRAESVARIREWLLEHDIILAGRYSEWEYYNSDHAFIAGKKAAETVTAREQEHPKISGIHAQAWDLSSRRL